MSGPIQKKHLVALGIATPWGVATALMPTLLSKPASVIGIAISLTLMAVSASVIFVRHVHRERLQRATEQRTRDTNGIVRARVDRNRAQRFAEPYDTAQNRIYVFGVGATNVSQDVAPLQNAVTSGKTVDIEMIDPHWVRRTPGMVKLLDDYYGRTNFIDQIEDSFNRLVMLRDHLNAWGSHYGGHRVRLIVVQEFAPESGTFADPETPHAWGYFEMHRKGFPYWQPLLKVVMYESANPATQPPMLEGILRGRRALRRQIVGPTATDRAPVP